MIHDQQICSWLMQTRSVFAQFIYVDTSADICSIHQNSIRQYIQLNKL